MTKNAMVRGLILVSALLAWSGCKKVDSSTTAA